MKNLLYKEFKLAMHPVCYLFTFLFPLMILIPNQPIFTSTFYIVPIMSVLFLGANKGKQSNDLFYTALLPVRKKDIVKGRMASVMFMEFFTLIFVGILSPIKLLIENNMKDVPSAAKLPGFTATTVVSALAFAVIGYSFVNAFFFIMFYKKGRSVTAPALCSTFVYMFFILFFTCILNIISPAYANFFTGFGRLYLQFVYLIVGLIIFFVVNYFVYRKASKELELLDL